MYSYFFKNYNVTCTCLMVIKWLGVYMSGRGGTPHCFRPQYHILFFILKTNFVFSAKNESLIKVDKLHFYLMT